jgi:hypothetical protein
MSKMLGAFKDTEELNFEFINRKQKVRKGNTVRGKECFIPKLLI